MRLKPPEVVLVKVPRLVIWFASLRLAPPVDVPVSVAVLIVAPPDWLIAAPALSATEVVPMIVPAVWLIEPEAPVAVSATVPPVRPAPTPSAPATLRVKLPVPALTAAVTLSGCASVRLKSPLLVVKVSSAAILLTLLPSDKPTLPPDEPVRVPAVIVALLSLIVPVGLELVAVSVSLPAPALTTPVSARLGAVSDRSPPIRVVAELSVSPPVPAVTDRLPSCVLMVAPLKVTLPAFPDAKVTASGATVEVIDFADSTVIVLAALAVRLSAVAPVYATLPLKSILPPDWSLRLLKPA